TKRHTACRQAIDVEEAPAERALQTQFDIPAEAMPSFELEHHQLAWYIAVGLGKSFLGDLRYPVTITPAAPPPDLPPTQEKSARRDFKSAALWIEGDPSAFLPGATLEGGYSI